MNRTKTIALGWIGVMAAIVSGGCMDGRDMQIQAQQEDINRLERERRDLEARLASSLRDGDEITQRALQLQQLVDDLRRQAADSAEVTQRDMFTEMGPYAWVDVGSDILFASGKATLKRSAGVSLREIANSIQQNYPDRDIWVVGHTDSDAILVTKNLWKDNLQLSQARARAVALELISAGIEASRMIAGGQGENAPRAANDTKANKALNRRVQIIAYQRPEPQGS